MCSRNTGAKVFPSNNCVSQMQAALTKDDLEIVVESLSAVEGNAQRRAAETELLQKIADRSGSKIK